MPGRPRVLFVCADPVGSEMAGLGIRNWELARVLTPLADVTVAHGGREAIADGTPATVPFSPHDPRPLRPLIAAADVIVAHPQWSPVTRAMRRSGARLVFDLYDPETLETLELLSGRTRVVREQLTATTLDRLHDALRSGHHFMCASEGQRDLWLGALLGLRMIDAGAYDRDPTYRSVIDVVPFGLPEQPPDLGPGGGVRDRVGIAADAELVLWNGGIWRWLDAPAAIRAIAALRQRRPRATLVFMGTGADHPAARTAVAEARETADRLGLLGSGVVFNEGWVPYEQRADWLAQADCALAAARDHLETRFAFRTRLLDCLWAEVPVVATAGDELAMRIEREDLGAVAPPGDAVALAEALQRVLERGRETYRPALREAARRARWSRAAAPLAGWVQEVADGTAPAWREARGLRPPVAQRVRQIAYDAVGRRLLAARR